MPARVAAGVYSGSTSVILIGAISRFPEAARANFKARADIASQDGVDGFVDKFVAGAFHPQTSEQHPEIGALTRDVMLRNDKDAYAAAIHGLLEAPEINYSAITCPTLVLVGDEDHATPKAMADELGAAISNSSVEVVQDGGHWCTLEQPKAIADQVRSFFGK